MTSPWARGGTRESPKKIESPSEDDRRGAKSEKLGEARPRTGETKNGGGEEGVLPTTQQQREPAKLEKVNPRREQKVKESRSPRAVSTQKEERL